MNNTVWSGTIVSIVAMAPLPVQAEAPRLNLTHERFVLDNGLVLVVHEDHTAPTVTVSTWYQVGSKNEPPGRSGFAHLFEHLMFNGSENFDGEWFDPMREIGATGVNGTTSFDRTNYYQTVPTPALDRVLWLESDRMGHLLGAIDQATLDEQRGVVQNEKRQGDNAPYGRLNYNLYEGLFPPEHPYHRSTIGSMEDLDAASLDDVRDWFRSYYGPNNTVIVLSGDITPTEARRQVELYFGHIPARQQVDVWNAWLPVRQHNTQETMFDDVPAALANRAWAVPGRSSRERALLDLAASILGDGRNSRFYRELVHERQVASQVSIAVTPFELASVFDLTVLLKPGQDVSVASEAIDRLMRDFMERGPTRQEMERAINGINASYVRAFESNAARAAALAEGELYANDPAFLQTYLNWINTAAAQDVRDAARQYLARGSHQVDVLPRGAYQSAPSQVDRSAGIPPAPDDSPALVFPPIETATLSNGARLVVIERRTVPQVQISASFNGGYAADQGGQLGTASFAMRMLTEGTRSRDALQLSAEADRLAANLSAGAGLDTIGVGVSAMRDQLEPSLALWADMLLNASFPDDAIERVRSQRLAAIAQERADPGAIANRILPPLLYGEAHAYGIPFTGTGTEASTRAITRADLVRYRDTWLRPDNATIFVVGDTNLAEVRPLLERVLRNWRAPSNEMPPINVNDVERPARPRLILVDRPGPQSLILGGTIGPRGNAPNDIAINAMNNVFGGGFTSRLNMNLREDKHWSYGAGSGLQGARGPRPFIVRAQVQTDRTGDSLNEIIRELSDINGSRPIRPDEMAPVITQAVRQLPGALQTQNAVLGSVQSAAIYGRPLDYAASLPERYEALTPQDLQDAARQMLDANNMVWVVIGDRRQVEPQLQRLNIAPIEIFTADGVEAQ